MTLVVRQPYAREAQLTPSGAERDTAGSGSDDDLIANSNHATWHPRFDSSDEESDSDAASEDDEDDDEDDEQRAGDSEGEPADGHDADESLTTGLSSSKLA